MARLRAAEELGRLEIEMRLATLPSVVLAELSQGVRNEGELSRLRAALGAVRWVATSRDIYVRAGRIGFELRRRGVTIPITDCLAAAAESLEAAYSLWAPLRGDLRGFGVDRSAGLNDPL